MDKTATKARRRVNGKGSKSDGWYGLSVKRSCRYCGHPTKEHDVMAQMAQLPGQRRRTRVGVAFMACVTCKATHGTLTQVMCYQFPEKTLQEGAGLGVIFSPPPANLT